MKSDEGYVGTKFQTVFVDGVVPDDARVDELVEWCRRFHALGLSPSYGAGSAGNLSVRTGRGFLITRTASWFQEISRNDFVEVVGVDVAARRVRVIGSFEPSSEAFMHQALYGARPDVQSVLHAHSDLILRSAGRLGVAVTDREQPYGTAEMAAEAVRVAADHDFFILRKHGLVSMGKTVEEAGQRVLEELRRAEAPL